MSSSGFLQVDDDDFIYLLVLVVLSFMKKINLDCATVKWPFQALFGGKDISLLYVCIYLEIIEFYIYHIQRRKL